MADSNDFSSSAIRKLEREADKQMRLVAAFERLAMAEEETAAALAQLDYPREADEMLGMSAFHYRRAADETRRAMQKRQQELDLINGSSM